MNLKNILFSALILYQTSLLFAAQAPQQQEPQRITPEALLAQIEQILTQAYINEVIPEYKKTYKEALKITNCNSHLTALVLSNKEQKQLSDDFTQILLNTIRPELTKKVQANVILTICHITEKKREEIPSAFITLATEKIVNNLLESIKS